MRAALISAAVALLVAATAAGAATQSSPRYLVRKTTITESLTRPGIGTVSASCPQGWRDIGGGFTATPSATVVVSEPVATNLWEVRARLPEGAHLTAWAECVS